MSLRNHDVSFRVIGDGAGSRFRWITDVLPHQRESSVWAHMERGAIEMNELLEAGQTSSSG